VEAERIESTPRPDSHREEVFAGLTNGSRLGHIGYMSAIAKSRIDPELKRQAEAVLEEIGLKPRAALELFYKQIIKRRAIPFPVQADSLEDEVLSPATRRNKMADEF
jgi:DNA-damage-inducible protein J